MMIFFEFILLMLGFIMLSLSMSRHYCHVTDKQLLLTKNNVWVFRTIGYSLLIIAIILAVIYWGVALGLVYCFGTTTLASIMLSMILTYRSHWLAFIPLTMKFIH